MGGAKRAEFFHVDLGIGGAENWLVNVALVLQKHDYDVEISTAHFDPGHCFKELKEGGPLAPCVRVRGAWLPRTLFGRFQALLANLKMVYAALVRLLLMLLGLKRSPDFVILDGVSAPMPILLLLGCPVLFYCHYPDKLLVRTGARRSLLRAMYRAPMDFLEEATTALASAVAVNSEFTAGVYQESFPLIRAAGRWCGLPAASPLVLYPSIDLDAWPSLRDAPAAEPGEDVLLTSLNRFERKKNIGLAIETLSALHSRGLRHTRLVVAGGYDPRVDENVEHLEELRALADRLGVRGAVSFRTNVSDEERAGLLASSRCVLYTPDKEHFGIVPLEAMYCGTPVMAVSSGGPLETIRHGVTGFLARQDAEEWAQALHASGLLAPGEGAGVKAAMGEEAHNHVVQKFGNDAFRASLLRWTASGRGHELGPVSLVASLAFLGGALTIASTAALRVAGKV